MSSKTESEAAYPVLLNYLVHKVNGQTPNTGLILSSQSTSLKANAEL
ncbi:hypothetical protein [Spirosoma endbachense]|uniref:Uncharacterized protein n=1 Tax=Spirosoma endbachense TaxID=2666025 RepID=A0A6P1VYD2_9BACT|nr:hypothetical protein [Spirosoma endbachense]QHV98153.1 hypothetical protein GJR95_25500 [Spirosoma endbachense]